MKNVLDRPLFSLSTASGPAPCFEKYIWSVVMSLPLWEKDSYHKHHAQRLNTTDIFLFGWFWMDSLVAKIIQRILHWQQNAATCSFPELLQRNAYSGREMLVPANQILESRTLQQAATRLYIRGQFYAILTLRNQRAATKTEGTCVLKYNKWANAYQCRADVNGAAMAFHKYLHVCGVKMPEDSEPMPTLRISKFPEGCEGPERASWMNTNLKAL